jgi:hypothetical protein
MNPVKRLPWRDGCIALSHKAVQLCLDVYTQVLNPPTVTQTIQ